MNLVAARMIAAAERRSLNVEGAFRHVVTDLFAFIATAIAGAVILISGFDRADGIASLLIAALMLWAAYGLLRDSGRVFMEAAPPGLDPQQIGRTLAAAEGVVEVHDLHVWEVTSGMPAISAHMIVGQRRRLPPGALERRAAAGGPLRGRALDPPGRARARRRATADQPSLAIAALAIRCWGPCAPGAVSPGLEPGEDETGGRDHRGGESVLEMDVARSGLVPGEEGGQGAGVVVQ